MHYSCFQAAEAQTKKRIDTKRQELERIFKNGIWKVEWFGIYYSPPSLYRAIEIEAI